MFFVLFYFPVNLASLNSKMNHYCQNSVFCYYSITGPSQISVKSTNILPLASVGLTQLLIQIL